MFPDADVKFFLTALPQARAERRFNEDRIQDPNVSFEETFIDMTERDRRDSTRADSPLKAGRRCDSDRLDWSPIDEVFAKMMAAVA